jgi:diadenylate cyclase
MGTFAPVIIIPMFILFQPEVRRALIRLGQNPLYRMFFKPHSRFTDQLVKAVFSLSRDKVGGLIAIEREVGLRGYVEGGVRLDAEVSAELIKTIFWPGTPLHDGAVVIRQQRLVAAGCLFPLTDNPQFSTELGTRHRAAIGITEESDAGAIVISEQTGQVSLAVGGTIQRDMNERDLRRALEEISAEVAQEE